MKFFCLTVLQLESRYLIAIAHYLHRLCRSKDFHIRKTLCFVLKNLVGLQAIHKFDNRYLLADACQVDGGFDTRITTSYYGYFLARIERTVTVRTERHATTDVFGFAFHIQPTPTGTCCNDNRRRTEHFAPLHGHLLFLTLEIG